MIRKQVVGDCETDSMEEFMASCTQRVFGIANWKIEEAPVEASGGSNWQSPDMTVSLDRSQ
jgi:hypothetical protein